MEWFGGEAVLRAFGALRLPRAEQRFPMLWPKSRDRHHNELRNRPSEYTVD
jgi:hypothetical protein